MKHLFLVHSPITYLTSVSVINKQKLTNNNAIIIFFEFEKIIQPELYIAVNINEFYGKNSLISRSINYFRYFNVFKRIDRLVNAVIGDEKFIAYVPALIWAGKALITHKKCVSFNFIEEGLAHYFDEETLNSLTPVNSKDPWRSSIIKNTKLVISQVYNVLRGYNFKLQSLPYSYFCYQAFKNILYYGLSSNSFPLVDEEKRIVVDFKKQSFLNIKQKFSFNLNDAVIWIGDGGVIQHGLNKAIYLNGIEQGCIAFIKQHQYKNSFIKFHRDETPALREAVRQIFTKYNIQFEVIPDSVIMELLLFKATNVTLIGVYSSLLYYAAIMNHSSFSIYNYLKHEYSRILQDRDFSFFWNKVNLIENNSEAPVNAVAFHNK